MECPHCGAKLYLELVKIAGALDVSVAELVGEEVAS